MKYWFMSYCIKFTDDRGAVFHGVATKQHPFTERDSEFDLISKHEPCFDGIALISFQEITEEEFKLWFDRGLKNDSENSENR